MAGRRKRCDKPSQGCAGLLLLCLAACGEGQPPAFQGYVEAEFVRVASPFSGTLDRLAVSRGMQVQAGAPLFTLESENEAAARIEAENRLKSAQARLANLKTGRRPVEIQVIRAQLDQAVAAERLSRAQLQRTEKLVADGFVSKERLDEARATHQRDVARVAELQAQIATARLAAREDEIRAAEAEVESARAALAQAAWQLSQKALNAPVAGLVHDTLFVQGEWVPAGNPVVSLLPPGNVKLRFFVPETSLGALKVGQAVSATCDGCDRPIPAQINFISRQVEFTPPVIYSKESRAKLVFLVEARPAPADAQRLHPGQPVDVRLQ